MLLAAVCDDESCQDIVNLIDRYRSVRIHTEIEARGFRTSGGLLAAIKSGQHFDLFLLGVIMQELNGIELARRLRGLCGGVPVIFMAASPDYAFDAFRVSAAQYLLKPVNDSELFSALDQVCGSITRNGERYFAVSTPSQTVRVPYSSITYLELAGRTIVVHLKNGGTLQSKTIRTSFAEAVAPLLEDSRFLCAHMSFVLNMDCAERLAGNHFIMENGAEVPIPRYKLADARAKYLAWLSPA